MGRPRRLILTAFAFTVLMATVAFWTAPNLVAQIRAALVKNVDEPGRLPYTSNVAGYNGIGCHVNCAPLNNLNFSLLPAVPSGKRLIVNHVFGGIFSGQLRSIGIASSSGANFDFQFDKLFFRGPFTFGDNTSYFDVQPFLTFEPGTNVWVTPGLGNCDNCNGYLRVSGYLIDASN